MTVAGGSNDATEEGSVSVVPITRAMMVGTGASRSGSVGCAINSLNEAPRLLETEVSGTSSEEV